MNRQSKWFEDLARFPLLLILVAACFGCGQAIRTAAHEGYTYSKSLVRSVAPKPVAGLVEFTTDTFIATPVEYISDGVADGVDYVSSEVASIAKPAPKKPEPKVQPVVVRQAVLEPFDPKTEAEIDALREQVTSQTKWKYQGGATSRTTPFLHSR